MRTAAEEFDRELAVFDRDVNLATQYFYAFQTTHYLASKDEQLLKAMNWNPLFWNTSLGALQEATFAALGRIFDGNQKSHSVHRLMRLASANPDIFSLEALRQRKRGEAAEDPDWLDGYMQDRYVPTEADWTRLANHLNRWNAVFIEKYRPLRHKVFAHRDRLEKSEVDSMYAATSYRELEKLLSFLDAFQWALRELFNNGRKPVLRPQRYSVVQMVDRPGAAKSGSTAQVMAHETQLALARIPNVRPRRRPTSAST